MKAIITVELDYPEQIYDLYETKEIRFYDKDNVYSLWEGGFNIKPMPEKKDGDFVWVDIDTCDESYIHGWNDCITEILGEEE